MRTMSIWQFVTVFLLIAATFAVPARDGHVSTVVAQDDDGGDDSGQEDGDDDDGGGGDGDDDSDADSGGDDDGDGGDDDNQSDGAGNDDGDDGQRDGNDGRQQNEGQGNEQRNENRGDPADVVQTEAYIVQVGCAFDADANTTRCIFTGVKPDGAQKINHITLPDDDVCTEVTDGDFTYVEPNPNANTTAGYRSTGNDATFTLVLDGEVTTAATTTYWLRTGGNVVPATGPGLSCEQAAAIPPTEAPDPASTPTETPTTAATATPDTSGEIAVLTYTCDDVPADTTSFDWFAECEPGDAGQVFTLANIDSAAGDPRTGETTATGEATFDALTPGTYELDSGDANWCHAESDNVTSESNLTVESGQRTTVWVFTCTDGTGKP